MRCSRGDCSANAMLMLNKSNGINVCLMQSNGNKSRERSDLTRTELSELPGGCSSSNQRFRETLPNPARVAGATDGSQWKTQATVQHPSTRRRPGITRFKGLGEISPKEFAQFIGREMRLSKIEYAPKPEAAPILRFYMGKNTPKRKDYIMDQLVVPVEERVRFISCAELLARARRPSREFLTADKLTRTCPVSLSTGRAPR